MPIHDSLFRKRRGDNRITISPGVAALVIRVPRRNRDPFFANYGFTAYACVGVKTGAPHPRFFTHRNQRLENRVSPSDALSRLASMSDVTVARNLTSTSRRAGGASWRPRLRRGHDRRHQALIWSEMLCRSSSRNLPSGSSRWGGVFWSCSCSPQRQDDSAATRTPALTNNENHGGDQTTAATPISFGQKRGAPLRRQQARTRTPARPPEGIARSGN